MEKKTQDFIFNNLRSTTGGGESSRLYVCTNVKSGKTEVVIEKTISERRPIQELEEATDLYERLSCGSGRKVFTLEQLAHPYNPN